MRHARTYFSLILLTGIAATPYAHAQQGVVQSMAMLALTGPGGLHASINAAELQTLPRQTVKVHNAHSGVDESYQGVELSTLLARIQAPLGAKLHGTALALYVVAQGADNYRAVYSLAEVDPAFHSGTVIVADSEDGKPIGPKDGPFKLVNTEDKRPARWVRNLVSLQLGTAP